MYINHNDLKLEWCIENKCPSSFATVLWKYTTQRCLDNSMKSMKIDQTNYEIWFVRTQDFATLIKESEPTTGCPEANLWVVKKDIWALISPSDILLGEMWEKRDEDGRRQQDEDHVNASRGKGRQKKIERRSGV